MTAPLRQVSMAVAVAAVMIVACVACGRSDAGIPRRLAYPRPVLLDTAMRSVAGLPVHFEVNAAATDTCPQSDWLDVVYSTYGTTLHVTFSRTDAAHIAEVKSNRMERMMLNNGDLPAHNTEWRNAAGWDVLVAVTLGSSTPVQFFATDDSAMVVSGAAFFGKATPIDSVKPYVDAVRDDIVRSMNVLSWN